MFHSLFGNWDLPRFFYLYASLIVFDQFLEIFCYKIQTIYIAFENNSWIFADPAINCRPAIPTVRACDSKVLHKRITF